MSPPEHRITAQKPPLISVFTVVKNGTASIERCIDSILNQDYPHFEIVVQDGDSTDGTIERLLRYGSRIRLQVQPDKGPAHGFHLALSRCRGEFIIGCLADEELLPGALSWGAQQFANRPELGAIYGDTYLTDLEGRVFNLLRGRPWDYLQVLCSEYIPCFASAFFRRNALVGAGLFELDPENYEGYADWCIWWRLGRDHPVAYHPGVIAKFSVHASQLGGSQERLFQHLAIRKKTIDQLMGESETPPEIRRLHRRALAGCHLHNVIQLLGMDAPDEAADELLKSLHYGPITYLARRLLLVLDAKEKIDPSALPFGPRLALWLDRIALRLRLKRIKQAVLFGTGYVARSISAICTQWEIEVPFYLDNATTAQGGLFLDRTVRAPEYLATVEGKEIQTVILATLGRQDEIGERLYQIGFRGRVIDLFAPFHLWRAL